MASPAAALFGSETLPDVLSVLTVNPGGGLTAAELSRRLGSNRESTQRALRRLVDAGLVTRVKHSNRVVTFDMDRENPSFGDLLRLSSRFAGLGACLTGASRELGPGMIDQAFLYGSAAALTDGPTSDLDVFVVGDARLDQVAPFLNGMRERFGREIQVVCRTRAQVGQGLIAGAAFYTNVWREARVMLLGRESDLPSLAGAGG
jgi:predicted nucleotidyltransferase